MLSINEVNSLINLGTEKMDLDYKESFNWDKSYKEDKYKIIKDILAMMNTKGGGRIIFGVKDTDYSITGLCEEDLISFDTTKINDLLEQFTDPLSYCYVFKYDIEGKGIVVIDVPEFEDLPIICKRDANGANNKHILKAGQIYIRTKKASSESISNSYQMRDIIERSAPKLDEDIIMKYNSLIIDNRYRERFIDSIVENSTQLSLGLNLDENLKVLYKPRINIENGLIEAIDTRVFIANTLKELIYNDLEVNDLKRLYGWYIRRALSDLIYLKNIGINVPTVIVNINNLVIIENELFKY